ncbi:hypothetical protein [Streptomyces scopuliridis]|uniref:hypothetical protein n=1 Tax=Streptomyces scopuliridis TaxID=452529 RepID=UPI00367BF215
MTSRRSATLPPRLSEAFWRSHREYFSGLLARLVKEGPRGGDEGFEAFNQALRRRVEA